MEKEIKINQEIVEIKLPAGYFAKTCTECNYATDFRPPHQAYCSKKGEWVDATVGC